MLSVGENQLTHVLTLVWALLYYMAIVLEQMVDEEFVEITMRAVGVFVDLSRKGLAKDQGIHEAARDRLELPEQHQQISIENC
jgi:hypothetical protein